MLYFYLKLENILNFAINGFKAGLLKPNMVAPVVSDPLHANSPLLQNQNSCWALNLTLQHYNFWKNNVFTKSLVLWLFLLGEIFQALMVLEVSKSIAHNADCRGAPATLGTLSVTEKKWTNNLCTFL